MTTSSTSPVLANQAGHTPTVQQPSPLPADRRFKMKWWGWGDPDYRFPLADAPNAANYMVKKLGVHPTEAFDQWRLENVSIPGSRADEKVLDRLAQIVGTDNCRTSHEERVLHSVGKGYKDLVRMRLGMLDSATDAVLYPRSEDEISRLIQLCQAEQIAIIPFGGGTSVVSGLEPIRGDNRMVISLDMALMNRLIELDEVSQTAVIEAGTFGPHLEKMLRERGFMLGHYPQSFEYSTLGGWIATRSSGQNSILYGGIEKLVESVRVVTPRGTVETLRVPRRADGPDLTQMLVGSEGTLGVIVSATVRIRPLPAERDYFAYAFKNFTGAVEAARTLLQSGVTPAMLRIADEEETEATLSLGQSHATGFKALVRRFGMWMLVRRGFTPPHLSVLMVGLEGTQERNAVMRRAIEKHLRQYATFALGSSPGRRWLETRFRLPYLRDELLNHHILVDTLETSTTWSRLQPLYEAVRAALKDAAQRQGRPIVVFAHVSHLYLDGASLYFTMLCPQNQSDPMDQWQELKRAANEAIRAQGAVISHHHAVGMDHKEHTGWGPVEREMLLELKRTLDPHGVMNPGKLL